MLDSKHKTVRDAIVCASFEFLLQTQFYCSLERTNNEVAWNVRSPMSALV